MFSVNSCLSKRTDDQKVVLFCVSGCTKTKNLTQSSFVRKFFCKNNTQRTWTTAISETKWNQQPQKMIVFNHQKRMRFCSLWKLNILLRNFLWNFDTIARLPPFSQHLSSVASALANLFSDSGCLLFRLQLFYHSYILIKVARSSYKRSCQHQKLMKTLHNLRHASSNISLNTSFHNRCQEKMTTIWTVLRNIACQLPQSFSLSKKHKEVSVLPKKGKCVPFQLEQAKCGKEIIAR